MVSLTVYNDDRPEMNGCCGASADAGEDRRCGNGLEKVYQTTAVRYGYMRHIGEFNYPEGMKFTCGAKVVIQTSRGIEIGEQVSLSCNGCDRHVSREQIKAYVANSGADTYRFDHGRILREATPDDLREDTRLRDRTRDMKNIAQRRANECLGPQKMRVVECEYLLGGERAIFYFLADGRVDFRGLVRDLSQEFQTRIQMHQVGARDEARLLADYETCGRQVCCKAFLKTLKPISMRMAKLQRATLDPSKVSGRCGRLKCCLRYEHESYESLDAKLPKKGEKLETTHGFGTVVDRQILTQLLQIELAHGGGIITVVGEDVLTRKLSAFPPAPAANTAPVALPDRSQPSRPPSSVQDSGRIRPTSETRRPHRSPKPAGAKPDRPRKDGPTPPDGQAVGDAPTRKPRRTRRRRRRSRGGGAGGDKPPRNA